MREKKKGLTARSLSDLTRDIIARLQEYDIDDAMAVRIILDVFHILGYDMKFILREIKHKMREIKAMEIDTGKV